MTTELTELTITGVGPDDARSVAAYAAVLDAVRAVDSPWEAQRTEREQAGALRFGWDGEPETAFLGTVDGVPVAAGSVSTSERDNLHLAWLGVEVVPDRRRQGLGTRMLDQVTQVARERRRTSVGGDSWDGTPGAAFAAHHGFEQRSSAINRRQVLADVDWAVVERLHGDALTRASAYELVRRTGAHPEQDLAAVAIMVSAINDAPTDDLDIEDEVFTPERIRAYETSQAGRGHTLHRVLARHRDTGELAGHSVVVVDGERPELGEQHDTSVVASHRGHRLGLLLKTEMNLWLREAQPQLTRIDTWNAESNDHMIGVNEQLGYRVLGRGLQFQRSL